MLRRGQAGPAAVSALILVFVLTLSLSLVTALPAGAQATAPVIETMQLRLWPEYDDPGLLVIQAGQFAANTTFPLPVAFGAPTGIRNIQATYLDETFTPINRPYEIKDGKLTYELPSAGFQVEYYLDRAPSGDQRTITYSYVAPYAINTLRVEVQQPARASSFTITPASEGSQTAADGLTYHSFSRRNVAAGETLEITISYSKTDTRLSNSELAVAPPTGAAQAETATAAPAAFGGDVLPIILIGLGVLLLAGILVYWLMTQRRAAPVVAEPPVVKRNVMTRSASPARSVRPTGPAAQSGEAAGFCTNCGNALKAEDRFCSQCGAPRRS